MGVGRGGARAPALVLSRKYFMLGFLLVRDRGVRLGRLARRRPRRAWVRVFSLRGKLLKSSPRLFAEGNNPRPPPSSTHFKFVELSLTSCDVRKDSRRLLVKIGQRLWTKIYFSFSLYIYVCLQENIHMYIGMFLKTRGGCSLSLGGVDELLG